MYEFLFKKYHVDQTTGLDQRGLSAAAHGMVDYFNSDKEYIDVAVVKNGQEFTLFNEREVVHLKDVKALFRFDLEVLWVTGAVVLLFFAASYVWRREGRIRFLRSVVWGCGLTVALMVVAGVGMLLDFDSLLLQFHLLSFANDFWLLDPSRDYLIMLVTHGFMVDASIIVAATTTLGAVVAGGLSWLYLRRLDTGKTGASPGIAARS